VEDSEVKKSEKECSRPSSTKNIRMKSVEKRKSEAKAKDTTVKSRANSAKDGKKELNYFEKCDNRLNYFEDYYPNQTNNAKINNCNEERNANNHINNHISNEINKNNQINNNQINNNQINHVNNAGHVNNQINSNGHVNNQINSNGHMNNSQGNFNNGNNIINSSGNNTLNSNGTNPKGYNDNYSGNPNNFGNSSHGASNSNIPEDVKEAKEILQMYQETKAPAPHLQLLKKRHQVFSSNRNPVIKLQVARKESEDDADKRPRQYLTAAAAKKY